jgi:hypothetical protein
MAAHARSPSWSRKKVRNPPRMSTVTRAAIGPTMLLIAPPTQSSTLAMTRSMTAVTSDGAPMESSHAWMSSTPARTAVSTSPR